MKAGLGRDLETSGCCALGTAERWPKQSTIATADLDHRCPPSVALSAPSEPIAAKARDPRRRRASRLPGRDEDLAASGACCWGLLLGF
jgi:hypothetical protein